MFFSCQEYSEVQYTLILLKCEFLNKSVVMLFLPDAGLVGFPAIVDRDTIDMGKC